MKTVVSFDLETNGRYPGRSSILQIGAVAFSMNGKIRSRFSMNLKPLEGSKPDKDTMAWWKTQPEESWKAVTRNPRDPKDATIKFYDWIAQFPQPRLLAAPIMYDGMFMRWYFEHFIGQSGHEFFHNGLDLRTLIFSFFGKYEGNYQDLIFAMTGKEFKNERPHYAVADAELQGKLFFAVLQFAEKEKLRRIL